MFSINGKGPNTISLNNEKYNKYQVDSEADQQLIGTIFDPHKLQGKLGQIFTKF